VILALETSCDDTCAAVVELGGEVRSNVISSQEVHDRFGGVVPEIAWEKLRSLCEGAAIASAELQNLVLQLGGDIRIIPAVLNGHTP